MFLWFNASSQNSHKRQRTEHTVSLTNLAAFHNFTVSSLRSEILKCQTVAAMLLVFYTYVHKREVQSYSSMIFWFNLRKSANQSIQVSCMAKCSKRNFWRSLVLQQLSQRSDVQLHVHCTLWLLKPPEMFLWLGFTRLCALQTFSWTF